MRTKHRILGGLIVSAVLATSVAVLHAAWEYQSSFGVDSNGQLSCRGYVTGNPGQPREIIMDVFAPSGTLADHCHVVGYGEGTWGVTNTCWLVVPREEVGTYTCNVHYVLGEDPTQHVYEEWTVN